MERETSNHNTMIRYTVHFAGHVQGVGFRYTTAHIARRHEVAGYVQNLPDGRVQMVCEGEPDEVDRFLEAIEDAMGRYIDDTTVERTTATGEYGHADGDDTFSVRY